MVVRNRRQVGFHILHGSFELIGQKVVGNPLEKLLEQGACPLYHASQVISRVSDLVFMGMDVFHQKAKMLSHEQVSELTGFPVGGVCPFLAPENTKVYLDESLKRFEYVYPAAGTRNSAVKVTVEELERAVRPAGWVDVGKLPQAE